MDSGDKFMSIVICIIAIIMGLVTFFVSYTAGRDTVRKEAAERGLGSHEIVEPGSQKTEWKWLELEKEEN